MGGGSSNDYEKSEQPAGKIIQSRYNGQWRVEEGYVQLKVKAELCYAYDRLVTS